MRSSFFLLLGTLAYAFSISGGIGYEEQKIGGYIKNGNVINYFGNKRANNPNKGYLGLKDEKNPFIWIKLTHDVSVFPNVKFQYTKYDASGYSNYIVGNVEIFDVKIPTVITNAYTSMKIDSYDVTFFYTFNSLFANIDAGIGVDYWKGHVKISTSNKTFVDNSWSVPLAYLYGKIETLKLYGVSLVGSLKWAKTGDNHHYDYLGAIKYSMPVNAFFKAGYRYKDIFGVDGDNETKLTYKGIFLEIGVEF